MLSRKNKIAISGFGCSCGAGPNAKSAFKAVQDGTVNCAPAPKNFFLGNNSIPLFFTAGINPSFPPIFNDINKSIRGRKLNPTLLLFLTALAESLEMAGLAPDYLKSRSVGIAIGTTVGCSFHDENYYVDWKNGRPTGTKPLQNYLTGNLSESVMMLFGLSGPQAVITNACASGTDALGLAKTWLEYGLCDVAFAGGADELSRIACRGFASLLLTSETPCTPFAVNRKGLNLGEGAGLMILERANDLKARNGRPRGWIEGYATANDAYHPTAPHPEGLGLQHAIQFAMTEAEVNTTDIGLINGHGTGTQTNDIAESKAIQAVGFDESTSPLISTKGATGHTLGAAGAIEAVFTLMSLNLGRTGGTIGCLNLDPELPYRPLSQEQNATLTARTGISHSLAFGGGNSALIIKGAGQ